jgi:hypothetical protein
MVRLPALAGSELSSPPDSPLKSFPWMRFVEDIVQEQDGGFVDDCWGGGRRGKGQEAS